MKRNAPILAILMAIAGLGACAQPRPTTPQSDNAGPAPVAESAMDASRDIVLAVANPIDPPATHAGSSLLGYTPSGNYGAGQRAASILAALKESYGTREITGWPIKALDLYCIVMEPPPGMSREALLAALAKDSRVQLAQPLQDFSVFADDTNTAHRYNDPYVNLQRGFVETDAAVAHRLSQGAGVHIAVIDTGVDMMHPDLQGSIGEARNLVDANVSAFTGDSHGTEVAGIIAALGDNHKGIVGMAPKAVLNIYKACWYTDTPSTGAHCNTFTLAKALAAVIDTNARVVNLSLGGPEDQLLGKLLAELLRQGRIVVAAMPPQGSVNGFPSNEPGVIVVRVSNSSTAPPGVLSAPGNDILTTQPGDGYDFASGSSMAAAHVSGIVALLLSLSPKLEAQTVHDLLLRSSKTSHGVSQVNAASAIAALRVQQKASP
jgi:hypothetical protein